MTHLKFNRKQRNQISRFVKRFHGKERVDLVEVFMAIAYLVKTGIQWNMLPDDYPKTSTVYYHFRKWNESGRLKFFLKKLIELKRSRRGRRPLPSVAVIDSQSVRSAYAPSIKDVDGFKRVKGVKRQIAVDADGLPLCVDVTTANFGTSDFVPLSGRWVVERTFSWTDGCRCLSRNYEKYLSTAQAMTYFAFILMLIRC